MSIRPTWRKHGWLPVAIPVDARSFRTDDDKLADSIIASGGTLHDGHVDMEIVADATRLAGNATCAAVTLEATAPDRGPTLAKRTVRIVRGVLLQIEARRAARLLGRVGYSVSAHVPWESEGAFLPGLRQWRGSRTAADVFPVHLALLGCRAGHPGATVLEASLNAASTACGKDLEVAKVLVRERCVMAIDEEGILRVGLGHAGQGVPRQVAALEFLRGLNPPVMVRSRVPRILGHGQSGIGTWSRESRVVGSSSGPLIDSRFEGDCIEFLLGLASVWQGRVSHEDIESDAEAVASFCPSDVAPLVRSVGVWIADRLRDHPGVLGHGDFFHGNLLADGGRLVGVVDWERGAVGRPAAQDLLHLRIAAEAERNRCHYGRAVVESVLHGAEQTNDDLFSVYLSRIGIAVGETSIVAVAGSCWLSQAAHELTCVADNAADSVWVHENVKIVAVELARIVAAAEARGAR